MKYFVIAPKVQNVWKALDELKIATINAGNTFFFFNEIEAKAGLRRLKLDAHDVTIVYHDGDKVLQKLATLFFN